MSLIDRAIRAYFKANADLPQPSKSDSGYARHRGRSYVVLGNVRGVLAVFRIAGDRLRRLKRWPVSVATAFES